MDKDLIDEILREIGLEHIDDYESVIIKKKTF
jgi:hypothetical protein